MRLDPVFLSKDNKIKQLLEYYMGKNTPDRQKHIVNNLRVELDLEEELARIAKEEQQTQQAG